MQRIFKYIFKDTFQLHNAGELVDRKVIVVVLTASVSLLLNSYFGHLVPLKEYLTRIEYSGLLDLIARAESHFPNDKLFELFYWASFRFLTYIILPLVLIRSLLKESLSDYGMNIRKAFSGYEIYLVFLVVMIPLVVLVSYTSAFQAKYPFYWPGEESLFPNFFIWQLFYLFQFVSVEFFFRGFMVHGTKHKLGFYSIFLMVIPYMMIHFQKPLLETTGAIIAGVFLGALSLRNNTIWQGILIHYSVGLAMDLAALVQRGYFE